MSSHKYLCVYVSSLMRDGYVATTTDDIKSVYLQGEYIIVTEDIGKLKATLEGTGGGNDLFGIKLNQLNFLKTLTIAFKRCDMDHGFSFNVANDLATELGIPLYHLILMEELCGHPYYYGNVRLTGSCMRSLCRRFLNYETRRIIDDHSTHKLMDYFEQALWDKYETGTSSACDYMLMYVQRFNLLIDSLNKSCHHFDKFVVLNEAVRILKRPSKESFPSIIVHGYYVGQPIIEYVYTVFGILKEQMKQAVKLVVKRVTFNWYEVSAICESNNNATKNKEEKMCGHFLKFVITVILAIINKYEPTMNGESLVYALTSSSDRNKKQPRHSGESFKPKSIVKTETFQLTGQEKFDKLMLTKKTTTTESTKRAREDDTDDDFSSSVKRFKKSQVFLRRDDRVQNKRLRVNTLAKYTTNAVIHGLNTYGIQCMTVNDRDKHIDHINNHVVHVNLLMKNTVKFLNIFREKSLVKSRLIKTNNMTVSIYKNMKGRGCSLNELIISLNVSGYSDLIRIGLLNIRKMGNSNFILQGQLKVSYTCETNRSCMVAHSNVFSFRPKYKKKFFRNCRKVENFNAMISGCHGKACIVHKACILSRCRGKKNSRRLLVNGYEDGCLCNASSSSAAAADRDSVVKGVCSCSKECCSIVRLKVLNKCLEDMNEVMEKPMPREWSDITFRLEKTRGELLNSTIDTGIKLGVIAESMTPQLKSKLFEFMERDEYVIISRYLVAQNDTFSLIKPVTINGNYPQTSKLPLVYSSKKNIINDSAIRYRPDFIRQLDQLFGSDVSTNKAKAIVQNKGSCNLFVKLPNVSNVVFNSKIFGTFVSNITRVIEDTNGADWNTKVSDTYALIREIHRARRRQKELEQPT